MTPELWERVQELFDRMLESSDPLATAAEESDARVRTLAGELWDNHVRASGAGFLDRPLTLVRNISGTSEPRFAEGRVLNARFAIERVLGQGGMGEVYLAFDQRLGARVAIKTIRSHLAQDASVRARFLAEVRNARQVTHPCVCRIFDLFEEGDIPFFSMEYVEGVRLSEWLSGPPPARRIARRIARELAEGLSAAHRNGIIHCDFKPANVLLTGDLANPHAVITDFGLARALTTAGAPNIHSLQAGTLDYMAPELLEGGTASVASDIFAYGKVLAQLLPGNRWAAACGAARVADRPKSLEPVVESLSEGLSRRTLVAGAAAGLSLAAMGGYELLTGPRLALAPHQRLIVNGFRSPDIEQAGSLRRLLITALRQSPLVSVVSDDRLIALLKKLRLAATLPAPRTDLALLAADVGGALFLEGAVEVTGNALSVVLEVFQPGQDSPGLKVGERVRDSHNLVRLADAAALRLRKEFGESPLSLRAAYRPLEKVTSASPEAVNYYLEGIALYEKADAEGAIVCLQRAVDLDSAFALAHLELATAHLAIDHGQPALLSYERAFALRHQATDRDRLWIEARYYNAVADVVSSLAACRRLAVLFPEEPVFQRATAFAFGRLGRPKEGLPYDERAVELDPNSDSNWNDLLTNTTEAGLCQEAITLYHRFRKEGRSSRLFNWNAGSAYMGLEDYENATRLFEEMSQDALLPLARIGRYLSCGPLVMQGRFAEAAARLESDMAYDAATGDTMTLEVRRSRLGLLELWMDHPGKARSRAAELAQLEASPIFLKPLCEGGLLSVLLNDADLSTQILDRLRAIETRWSSTHSRGSRACLEGALMDLKGDPKAGEWFREAVGLWPDPVTLLMAGHWHATKGNPAVALDALQSLDQQRMRTFRLYFPGLVVASWIEQARCLARMSRFEESLRVYKRVLDHWLPHAGGFAVVQQVRTEHNQLFDESLRKRR
jgi:tetratricopeptide (TPR) repeat protein/tRNA A-37 threonylcarbamoyl transferase component Bud32